MAKLKARTLKDLEMKNFFIKKSPPEKGRGKSMIRSEFSQLLLKRDFCP